MLRLRCAACGKASACRAVVSLRPLRLHCGPRRECGQEHSQGRVLARPAGKEIPGVPGDGRRTRWGSQGPAPRYGTERYRPATGGGMNMSSSRYNSQNKARSENGQRRPIFQTKRDKPLSVDNSLPASSRSIFLKDLPLRTSIVSPSAM